MSIETVEVSGKKYVTLESVAVALGLSQAIVQKAAVRSKLPLITKPQVAVEEWSLETLVAAVQKRYPVQTDSTAITQPATKRGDFCHINPLATQWLSSGYVDYVEAYRKTYGELPEGTDYYGIYSDFFSELEAREEFGLPHEPTKKVLAEMREKYPLRKPQPLHFVDTAARFPGLPLELKQETEQYMRHCGCGAAYALVAVHEAVVALGLNEREWLDYLFTLHTEHLLSPRLSHADYFTYFIDKGKFAELNHNAPLLPSPRVVRLLKYAENATYTPRQKK